MMRHRCLTMQVTTSHIALLVLVVATPSLVTTTSQNESQPNTDSSSKSQPVPFVKTPSQAESVTSQHLFYETHNNNKKDTTSSSLPYNLSDSNGAETLGLHPESPLIKSLKSLKIANSLNLNTSKKKNFPGVILQNFHEKQLNDDILSDLTKFGAYSKLMSQLMHSIINKELGVATMQQKIDKMAIKTSTIRFDNVIDGITEKMIKKIQDAHSVIEVTGERIQEIFKQYLTSNITTSYMSCCDFYTAEFKNDYKTNEFLKLYTLNSEYDLKLLNSIKSKEQEVKNIRYQFESHFNTWINRQYACDIGDNLLRSHFFSPSGPNLTEQFQANLAQNPSLKWQYFMSFVGVHTEYPSYLPPNNYCFLHNFNAEQFAKLKSNSEFESERASHSNGFHKRFKFKSKKHDSFYHHKKAYQELNQLFAQRHRENLFTTALPQSKLVVIVVDRGSALTEHQMNTARSLAKYILNSLSHRDKVAVVDLTSEVHYPSSETCSSKLELAYANYETKHFYGRYIDDLQRCHNSTNHHLGFQRAFEIISTNYEAFKDEIQSEPEIFIPYISRGLLASLADAKPVMQLIADEVRKQNYSFVINTYALVDESKPIIYETSFLRELASMHFRKFKVDTLPPPKKVRTGLMVELNNTDNLSFILNGIYTVLSKPDYDAYSSLYLSLPHYDFISKDTHVSISKSFLYRDRLIGVVGVDISFFDLAEDVIHYDGSTDSYAFLMDAHSGKLLYHPYFAYQSHANLKRQNKFASFANYDYYSQNSFTNVEHVEQADEFLPVVKRLIMSKSTGEHTIPLTFAGEHSEHASASNESYFHLLNDRLHILKRYSTITYHWRRILNSPYVVVIAVYGNGKIDPIPYNTGFHLVKNINFMPEGEGINFNVVSHRLDYLSNLHPNKIKLCKHFNQLATIETATLYLTPNAFVNHYLFEVDGDSFENVQRYMAYLTDSTFNIENPGLKPNVRGDVNALSSIIDIWKEILDSSDTSKYTVRKYIATISGAFLVYPGSLLDQSYDSKTRPWFQRAIANPGKLIIMPPYLDVGGGGYIVTLSQTIYEGKANGQHSENDRIWAVMGIDLTLGYFHKIIDEMVPICTRNKSSCFIMDDYGYLIVHSSFLRPSLSPFIERQHITHKEPQMVDDLLNQKNFVRKLVCNSYTDRTIQRYYMFNSSLVGVVTNIVQNEDYSCAKYKVVSLDSTNVFFGIVNHTCDNSTKFCPCSQTDRLCLNCHRMEQTDCECPCECPLVMNLCNGQLLEKEDQNPSCISTQEPLREPSVPKYLFDSLDSCINSECFSKHSESECKGVLGCEWCSMDNGLLLKKPFCTNQNLCFGGNYGSKNPYLSNYYFHHRESYKPIHSTPIGPLSSTIIICFIILVFSVYCFHFQSSRNFTTRYLNTNHNEHQILQQPNECHESQDHEFGNESNFEAAAVAQAAQANPNYDDIASPYQINIINNNDNYRRNESESDFGYSTMSPNDDSELNGPIYINPKMMQSAKKSLDLLDISISPTSGTASVVSNDDLSTMSSPSMSSVGELVASHKRLPPPPSKSAYKVRTKQKYVDKSSDAKSSEITNLPVVCESTSLEEEATLPVSSTVLQV